MPSLTPVDVPRTWGDTFKPEFMEHDYDNVPTASFTNATIKGNVEDATQYAIDNPELMVMTNASGKAGSVALLHNFNSVEDADGDKVTSLLTGLGSTSNILAANTGRLFSKKHNIKVPKPSWIVKNMTKENWKTIEVDDSNIEDVSICQSHFVPPRVAQRFTELQNLKTETVFESLLSIAKEETENLLADMVSTDYEGGLTLDEALDENVELGQLLQQTFAWSRTPSLKNNSNPGFELSLDPAMAAQQEILQKKIQATKQEASNTDDRKVSFDPQSNKPAKSPATPDQDNEKKRPANEDEDEENKNESESESENENKEGDKPKPPTPSKKKSSFANINTFRKPALKKQRGPNQESSQRQTNQDVNAPAPTGLTDFSQIMSTQVAVMTQLGSSVTQLAKVQEQNYNLQAQLQERKELGKKPIHYTTTNFFLRAGTTDGMSEADSLTPLAAEMLGSRKQNHAYNILLLTLNEGNIKCDVHPQMIDAMCTGNLVSRNPFEPSAFSLYNCPPSFYGTSLQEMDLFQTLSKDHNELSDKERELINKTLLTIATTPTMLLKLVKHFSKITNEYIGKDSSVAYFLHVWKQFITDNEDALADLQREMDQDLPAKIQWNIAFNTNSFFSKARFEMPDEGILQTTQLMRNILQGNSGLTLPKFAYETLHPSTSTKKKPVPEGDTTSRGGGRRRVECPNHDNRLKLPNNFFQKVIRPYAVEERCVPTPMFDNDCEECLIFSFNGFCRENCRRKKAHKPHNNERKKKLLTFKSDCLAEYNKNKSESDPDF